MGSNYSLKYNVDIATVMYVDVPKKLNAYVYKAPDNSSSKLPRAYQGSKVTVLAEESGYYCILYTDDQNVRNAGWINKTHVTYDFPGDSYDIGDAYCTSASDYINYGDACTSWSDEPFEGTDVLFTKIDSLPSDLQACRGMTIEYKITGKGTNDNLLRDVYINCGDGWESCGTFMLDKALSPVRINCYFEEPVSVSAGSVVPTDPDNSDYSFRQTVVDVIYDYSYSLEDGFVPESTYLASVADIEPSDDITDSLEAEFIPGATYLTSVADVEPDVDITEYGMSSHFTDAGDNAQVMRRAQDIYDKYIDLNSIPATIKAELSVERIANVIRLFNGEFPRTDNEIDYNASSIDEMANIYAVYCNATSLEKYGTNLEFKPSCVFFEENSLAHMSAVIDDELLSAIYSDIVACDITKFIADAVKWGEYVRDTFIYNDFTGETISIRAIDSEQQFPLAVSIISAYAPSIYEFALNTDLATGNGNTGDTFGISIPYSYDANGKLQTITLSKMLYDINYTSMNALAKRAGASQEEISEETDPIIIQTYNATLDWYNSKYDLERR